MSSSALVENGRRLLLCPPLRGERGTAPSVRTTQPTSREHLRDRDEFFPRLPPRGAASHFRRVDSRPIREIDDASHARGEPIDQGLGIGELPADGFWQIGEHRLGGLRTAASIRADRAVRSPFAPAADIETRGVIALGRHPSGDVGVNAATPVVRDAIDGRGTAPDAGKHETAGYRGRTDRRPRSPLEDDPLDPLVAFDRDRAEVEPKDASAPLIERTPLETVDQRENLAAIRIIDRLGVEIARREILARRYGVALREILETPRAPYP